MRRDASPSIANGMRSCEMGRGVLLILFLLPGCTLLFSPVPNATDGLDGGLAQSHDAILGNERGTPDAPATPDSSPEPDGPMLVDASVTPDAMAIPDAFTNTPDAVPCDPFLDLECYVENDPLSGPTLEMVFGSAIPGEYCEHSRECLTSLFCAALSCEFLCDASHPCLGSETCVNLGYKGYGFCQLI